MLYSFTISPQTWLTGFFTVYDLICRFQKGLLHEKKNEFHEAQMCYQNALAINPYHLKSLRHLVSSAVRTLFFDRFVIDFIQSCTSLFFMLVFHGCYIADDFLQAHLV